MNSLCPNIFNALEIEFARSPMYSVVLIEEGLCGDCQPSRDITMWEGRDITRSPDASPFIREAIWATLVQGAQTDPTRWQPAAIWMMLPSLRAITNRLHRTWGVDIQDIRSDVIIGFIESLQRADPYRKKLGAFLWWATFSHARHGCQQLTRETTTEDINQIAERNAVTDHSISPPVGSVRYSTVALPPMDTRDRTRAEGERLGSIAQRLGLRQRMHGRRQSGVTVNAIDSGLYRVTRGSQEPEPIRSVRGLRARAVAARRTGDDDAA